MEFWEKFAVAFGLICGLSLTWVQVRHLQRIPWREQGWGSPEVREALDKPADRQGKAALSVALVSFLLMIVSIGLWFK